MDKLLAAFERLKSGYKSRSSVILFDFWTWFSNMQKSMLLYVSTLDCCWSGTFAASETMQAMSSKKTESHHALHTVWKRPHRVHDRDHISVNDDRSTMVILMGIAERIDPPSVDFCVWCKPPRRGVTFQPLLFVRNSLCVAFWVFEKSILFLDFDDGVSGCVMTKRVKSSSIWHFVESLARHIITPEK